MQIILSFSPFIRPRRVRSPDTALKTPAPMRPPAMSVPTPTPGANHFGLSGSANATGGPILERVAKYPQPIVCDDMKFLNAQDKRCLLSKTIERVWPFPA